MDTHSAAYVIFMQFIFDYQYCHVFCPHTSQGWSLFIYLAVAQWCIKYILSLTIIIYYLNYFFFASNEISHLACIFGAMWSYKIIRFYVICLLALLLQSIAIQLHNITSVLDISNVHLFDPYNLCRPYCYSDHILSFYTILHNEIGISKSE